MILSLAVCLRTIITEAVICIQRGAADSVGFLNQPVSAVISIRENKSVPFFRPFSPAAPSEPQLLKRALGIKVTCFTEVAHFLDPSLFLSLQRKDVFSLSGEYYPLTRGLLMGDPLSFTSSYLFLPA